MVGQPAVLLQACWKIKLMRTYTKTTFNEDSYYLCMHFLAIHILRKLLASKPLLAACHVLLSYDILNKKYA